jgi:hypothetical protein
MRTDHWLYLAAVLAGFRPERSWLAARIAAALVTKLARRDEP